MLEDNSKRRIAPKNKNGESNVEVPNLSIDKYLSRHSDKTFALTDKDERTSGEIELI